MIIDDENLRGLPFPFPLSVAPAHFGVDEALPEADKSICWTDPPKPTLPKQPIPERANIAIDPKVPFGRKEDGGKPIAGALPQYFPRALLAVAEVATFGAKKYERGNWLHVVNGRERYFDAAMRHILQSHIDPTDAETGMPHMAHAAWNLLAVLELTLRQGGAK